VVKRLLGGKGVLEGRLDISVECLRPIVNWWDIVVKSDGGRFWQDENVLHSFFGSGQVGVRVQNFLINSEVWNWVVLWWSWSWLFEGDFPFVVEISLGVLGELQGGLDILILTEVWNNVISWVSVLALIFEVGQKAVTGFLRGGASWIIHNESLSNWVMVMVVVPNVDGSSFGKQSCNSEGFEHFNKLI
jgi:hypothetical protein